MGAEADRQVLMVARLGALLAVGAAPAAKLALARAKLNRLFTCTMESVNTRNLVLQYCANLLRVV
jgi:hypothetical protein